MNALRTALWASGAVALGCGGNSGDGTPGNGGHEAGTSSSAGSSPASAGSGTMAVGGENPGGAGAASAGTGDGGAPGVAGANSAGSAGGKATAGAPGSAGSAGATGAAGASTKGGDLWISPTGNDSNAGTDAAPLLNLPNALARVAPGSTIWVKAGTYAYAVVIKLSKSGTAAAPYTIAAVPGTRPLINFATQPKDAAVSDSFRGFDIQGDYWRLSGFEVENASDNCVAISGSHNTIEDLTIHNCGDTGLQITASSAQATDDTRAAANLILNCDSYDNFDPATKGENADGFAAKLRIGPGNVFRGCRAYNNSDDGWDFFAADDVVEVDGCWAFLNGKTSTNAANPAGDGNGFKLGGKPTSAGEGGAVHLVKGSFAFQNLACGYTQNSNPEVPKLTACGAKDNATDYCQTLSQSGAVSMSMTAAQAKAVKRNADGSLPAMK